MGDIIDTLITDRTQADVDRGRYLNARWDAQAGRWTGTAEEWAEWSAGPRGAYGFADMNRVTQAVAYLTGRLGELGYSVATEGVVPAYNIQVSVCQAGGGTAAGGGIFFRGDEITVTAQPGEKYDFAGWLEAGEIVSGDPAYIFTVERSRSLTAVFALKQFRVDVSVDPLGSGEVSGAGVYDIGTVVTVAALAGDGYAFTRWTEGSETVDEGPEYTFTLDRNRVLSAVMTRQYIITTTARNDDFGTVTGAGMYLEGQTVTVAGMYLEGQTVTVAAVAQDGYEFTGWQENGQMVSQEAVYSFPAEADRALEALFVRVHIITLLVEPAGWGTVQGGGAYREGGQVTITAAPEEDYRFVAWTEDGEQISTDPTYKFTVEGNHTLTALFELIPVYTVTVSIDPAGSGTVTGAGQYREGESVTVNATAADGYAFSKWQVSGEDVGTGDSYMFTVTGDVEIVAVFLKKESRLPEGYTEVEYVEAAGAAYVNTKINQVVTGRYLLDMEFGKWSGSVTYSYLYTDEYVSGSTTRRFSNQFGKNSLYYRYGLGSAMTFSVGETEGRHVVEIDMKGNQIKFDEKTKNMFSSAITIATGKPIKIGVAKIPIKWFSAKFYKDDSLVCDLVPCVNSANVAGFYDLVRNSFYTLTGTTGTLTPGPAV